MSILHIEGFEQFASGEDIQKTYPAVPATYTLITTTALGRGKAVSAPAAAIGRFIQAIPTQAVNTVVGFTCRIRVGAYPPTIERRYIVVMAESTTNHAWLSLDSEGYMYLNTKMGTQYIVNPLQLNRWYHLEVKFRIDDTNGMIEARLDGKTVLYATGDTRVGVTGIINSVVWNFANNSASGTLDMDDVVIWNTEGTEYNDWLGDVEVQTIFPTADDVVTGWTANTGTVWDAINDDGEDTDVTYISSATVGSPASFVMGDLLTTPNKILAVQVFALARKDDSGGRSIKVGISSNGVTSDGDDNPLGLTYAPVTKIFEKNPDGAVAWTAATVNALKGRVQVSV